MPAFQSYRADCGPTALQNALDALGHIRSHDELVSLCGTTADGTSPRQLRRAIGVLKESCDLQPGEIKDRYDDVALLRLAALLDHGRPAILLVDSWSHYVAAVGRLGDIFIICDSADLRQTLYLSAGDLIHRWAHPEVPRVRLYGLSL